MAIYKERQRIWTWDYQETNPTSDRVEDLGPGPPDYNTCTLNHWAMLHTLQERGQTKQHIGPPGWGLGTRPAFTPGKQV